MRKQKETLSKQLLQLGVVIFTIVLISLGLILPNALLPIYENNIYQYLKQPLELIDYGIGESKLGSDVVYLYITSDNEIITSDNFTKIIIRATPEQIAKHINEEYGKLNYLGKTYYYNTSYNNYVKKISITNDSYIKQMKQDILWKILPVILVTFILVIGLILLWSRKLVKKIEHLKQKVDNISNEDYQDTYKYDEDDELKMLSDTIDEMRITLKEQEEYKNQMYQNISHDFKTPLTVIKSYIEAIEDGVETTDKGLSIIDDEIKKLELKVHSLLYLNKLNYIKDSDNFRKEKTDVALIIRSAIDNYKIQAPNLKWEVSIDKNSIFTGTQDMWEAVIYNLLGNFIRYADKKIKITIKKGTITLYNDGPNIDPNILSDIFTPYKKGINGQFGLGLSIVKKTMFYCGYEITVKNEKKGVSFMIK